MFLPNTLSTDVTVVSDKERVNFFIVTLVYSGYIAFPYIMHFIHLSHFLLLYQKKCVPYIILYIARLSLFHTESIFLPNTLSTDVTVVSDKERVNFFIVTLVYSG